MNRTINNDTNLSLFIVLTPIILTKIQQNHYFFVILLVISLFMLTKYTP